MKNPTRSTASQFHMSSCVEAAFQQAHIMSIKAREAHRDGLITAAHALALTKAALDFRDAINRAHAHVVALDSKVGSAPTV